MITDKIRERRRQYIGSSDTPKLLGVSPFGTAQDVYWSKVAPDESDKPTESMETGNRLERAVLDYLAERFDRSVSLAGTFRVGVTLCANLDGWLVGKARKGCYQDNSKYAAEVKVVSGEYRDEWGADDTDEIPAHVAAQVQHQLAVTGGSMAFVGAALIGNYGVEWRAYRINRDIEIIRGISETASKFWNENVLKRIPPDPSAPPPLDVLRRLKREPQAIEIDGGSAEWFHLWEECRRRRIEAEGCEKSALAVALQSLGPYEAARLPDGSVFTYKEVKRKGYTVEPSTYRVPRLKLAKELTHDDSTCSGGTPASSDSPRLTDSGREVGSGTPNT